MEGPGAGRMRRPPCSVSWEVARQATLNPSMTFNEGLDLGEEVDDTLVEGRKVIALP